MKKLTEEILYAGNWITLKVLSLSGQDGQIIQWECVERKNRHIGMVILPKLVPSNRIVLIKQYRPAISNYIIGFPAGIAESGDIGQEALRELREETGFIGKITRISPPLKSNPAFIDDYVYVINAEIDETAAPNLLPVQNLGAGEDIEVILVKEDEMLSFLEEQNGQGMEIGIGPWYVYASRSQAL
ncbi:adp-ribose pyrophosphatase [hydrocarbon metagenome]|uniref:Adp-ribose pyrophosphatase n=1 Tax=hydrocarbon metagenome TaxID=938273 RepID=A0A0W8E6K7_9ZZZZ